MNSGQFSNPWFPYRHANQLDEKQAAEGIEMIAPHRRNYKKPKTQDSHKMGRFKRRWKVERLFA